VGYGAYRSASGDEGIGLAMRAGHGWGSGG
jgi:hypothetical protein